MDWVDEENDLSTVIGSGTRIASETARDGSDNTPKLPIRTINGKRYLEVDQSANRLAGSRISPFWQHGLEGNLLRMRASTRQCKRLITPDQNALGDDLIEALEYLKAWWDNGLVPRH
jgi:hypothetical protein